jgi:hypothetical protein
MKDPSQLRRGEGSVGRRFEDFAGGSGVVFADQNFETEAGPGHVFAHATHGVGLNHRGNASGFEFALGEVGFGASAVGVDNDEVRVVHAFKYTPASNEEWLPGL